MQRNRCTSRTVRVVAAVGAVLAGGAAEATRADENERGSFELELTSPAPAAPTGLTFQLRFGRAQQKPPALTGATFTLPAGMKIDDTAVPQCTATDAELRALGRAACPADSQVGSGELTAYTGFPGVDPAHAETVAFNGPGQIIEVVFFGGVVAGIDRLTLEDGRVVAHPPTTPGGPPDGRTTISELRLELPERVGPDGRAYITSPPRCPADGWVARADYTFADGGTASLRSVSECERPALRVAVQPRRIPAGERRSVRVAVSSPVPDCAAGARVRVAGARARTDADGVARLRVRVARSGTRKVVASRPGCRPARAWLRVVAG